MFIVCRIAALDSKVAIGTGQVPCLSLSWSVVLSVSNEVYCEKIADSIEIRLVWWVG